MASEVKTAKVMVENVKKAAALRRAMIQDVETVTFDILEIERNDSYLHDEHLSSRVGALVLAVTSDFPEAGTDVLPGEKGCRLAIEATDRREVLASDIITIPGVRIVHDCPLTILPPKGKLVFTAYPRRGTGRIHTKWSPVSAVFFEEKGNGVELTYEPTGALTADEILDAANALVD